MEIGKDFFEHLRAHTFMGFLSIRNGVFVVSVSQLLFGVALYCIMHYLHPSLTGVALFLLGLHLLVGTLGLVGAFKRSMPIHFLYMVFYAISMAFVTMVALDMSEIVHFLPKAPQFHGTSMFKMTGPLVTKFKAPNASVLFPFNFYREAFLSGADPNMSNPVKGPLLGTYSVTEIDMHTHCNHGKCKRDYRVNRYNMGDDDLDKNRMGGFRDVSYYKEDEPSDVVAQVDGLDDLNKLKKLLGEKLADPSAASTVPSDAGNSGNATPTVDANTTVYDANNNLNNTDNPSATESVTTNKDDDTASTESGGEKEKDTLYDHIPFLPHPGETEGESEDVSKDEFPPETNDLTPEGKSEVVVMYKMQKRSVKFAAASFLLLALLFYLYSYWIAVTFFLNKCSSYDQLAVQPDNYTPVEA